MSRVAGAGVTAQLVKPLPYKLRSMSVRPRTHETMPGMVGHTCNPRAGELQASGPQSVRLAWLANSWPARDAASKPWAALLTGQLTRLPLASTPGKPALALKQGNRPAFAVPEHCFSSAASLSFFVSNCYRCIFILWLKFSNEVIKIPRLIICSFKEPGLLSNLNLVVFINNFI